MFNVFIASLMILACVYGFMNKKLRERQSTLSTSLLCCLTFAVWTVVWSYIFGWFCVDCKKRLNLELLKMF